MPPPLRFLVLLTFVAPAAAQPFETIEVSAGGAMTIGSAPYSDFWDPGLGGEVRAEAPFYLGRVAVGALVAPHEAVNEGQPDYLSFYFYGSWGVGLDLGPVRLTPGLRAGLFRMQFDTDDAVAVRNESELAVGPELWASADLGRGWRVRAGGGTARVFTNRRIDLGFAGVGVSRTFGTPRWLRDFLR